MTDCGQMPAYDVSPNEVSLYGMFRPDKLEEVCFLAVGPD